MKVLFTYLLFFILPSVSFGQTAKRSIANDPSFSIYFYKNIRFPEKSQEQGKQGTLYVSFTINKRGEIINPLVENPNMIDGLFELEVRKVCQKIPNQNPTYKGHYVMPVDFVLDINKRNQQENTPKEAQQVVSKPNYILLNEIVVEKYGPPMR